MDYPLYELNNKLCIQVVRSGFLFKNGSRLMPVRCGKPLLYNTHTRCAEHMAAPRTPLYLKEEMEIPHTTK